MRFFGSFLVLVVSWTLLNPASTAASGLLPVVLCKGVPKTVTCKRIAPGLPFETAAYVYKGANPGPVVLVQAGIHGNEPAGTLALEEWIQELKVTNGTLVLIPRMNVKALEVGRRFVDRDLNRSFPGDGDARQLESRLASYLYKFVQELHPELVITLHESRLDQVVHKACCGHSLIHVTRSPSKRLKAVLQRINQDAKTRFDRFVAHYARDRGACSETYIDDFGAEAYSVESWVKAPLPQRITLHQQVVQAFLDEWGVKTNLR